MLGDHVVSHEKKPRETSVFEEEEQEAQSSSSHGALLSSNVLKKPEMGGFEPRFAQSSDELEVSLPVGGLSTQISHPPAQKCKLTPTNHTLGLTLLI